KREREMGGVGGGGDVRERGRADGDGVNTVEMATLKARTAALRGRPSAAFATRVKERPGFLMVPNCLGVPGGVPVIFEDECIGGGGVSGIDHDDETGAEAGGAAARKRQSAEG